MFRVARHSAHPTVVDCDDYHAVLSVADQWTQLKTGSDSPEFRRWANPFTFMTSCYDNRVITRLDFDTREEFAQQIEDIVKFHAMNDAWRGIDPPSDYVREQLHRGRSRTLHEAAADTAAAAAEGRPRRRGRHATRSRRVNRTAIRDVRTGPRRSRPLRPTISRIRLAVFTHDAFRQGATSCTLCPNLAYVLPSAANLPGKRP